MMGRSQFNEEGDRKPRYSQLREASGWAVKGWRARGRGGLGGVRGRSKEYGRGWGGLQNDSKGETKVHSFHRRSLYT